MGEAFLVALALVAFVVVFAVNAHGKARAFRRGAAASAGNRSPDEATSVSLPTPRFHRGDTDNRRGKSS